MSLFASVAIVCTMSACNNYFVDVATDSAYAETNTSVIQTELDYAMQTESAMERFLDKYQIGETVFEIVSIDIETHSLKEDEFP